MARWTCCECGEQKELVDLDERICGDCQSKRDNPDKNNPKKKANPVMLFKGLAESVEKDMPKGVQHKNDCYYYSTMEYLEGYLERRKDETV